jgi:hypothetical protein
LGKKILKGDSKMFKGCIPDMQQMMKQVQKMMHQLLKVSPREDSPQYVPLDKKSVA